MEVSAKSTKRKIQKRTKEETMDYYDMGNDDCEDDMKLYELKQKMELDLKPNYELGAKQCRACAELGQCVDIFQQKDDDGLDAASKLLIICGIEVSMAKLRYVQPCIDTRFSVSFQLRR